MRFTTEPVIPSAEVTTKQAANLLLVSKLYLAGMIERGELPARMAGNQPRLPLKAVLAHKAVAAR